MGMFQEVTDIQPDDISLFPPEYEVLISDKKLRNAIYEAFGGKCAYTKRELSRDNFHIDHVIPRSKGGKDNIYNYVLCCPDINVTKSGNYDSVGATLALSIVRQVFAPRVIRTMKQMKDESEKKAQVVHETKRQVVQSVDEKLYITKVEEKISEIGELLLSVLKNQTIILANRSGRREIKISFSHFGSTMSPEELSRGLNGGEYGIYSDTHFSTNKAFPGFGIGEIIRENDNFTISIIFPENIENRKSLPPSWIELCDFVEDLEEVGKEGEEILSILKKQEILSVTEENGDYKIVFMRDTFERDSKFLDLIIKSGKVFFQKYGIKYRGFLGGEGDSSEYIRSLRCNKFPLDDVLFIPASWFEIEMLFLDRISIFK